VLAGNPDAENAFENTRKIIPGSSVIKTAKTFKDIASAMSLKVLRI